MEGTGDRNASPDISIIQEAGGKFNAHFAFFGNEQEILGDFWEFE